MKKFLYCLELESGARLIAGYCAATNVAYIFALFSIYQHMDVKKVMSAMDEVKALGLAAFINFMIYYIVGSLLLVVGVNEHMKACSIITLSFLLLHIASQKKYKTLLYYLKVHGTMTGGIGICGPIFSYYFGNSQTMLMILFDTFFRLYSLCCIYSLYKKFKYEHREREKMEASEKAFASYGTANAEEHHTVTEK